MSKGIYGKKPLRCLCVGLDGERCARPTVNETNYCSLHARLLLKPGKGALSRVQELVSIMLFTTKPENMDMEAINIVKRYIESKGLCTKITEEARLLGIFKTTEEKISWIFASDGTYLEATRLRILLARRPLTQADKGNGKWEGKATICAIAIRKFDKQNGVWRKWSFNPDVVWGMFLEDSELRKADGKWEGEFTNSENNTKPQLREIPKPPRREIAEKNELTAYVIRLRVEKIERGGKR